MPYTFLSDAWLDEVKKLAAEAGRRAPRPDAVTVNLVVTGGPEGDRELHVADGSFGAGLEGRRAHEAHRPLRRRPEHVRQRRPVRGDAGVHERPDQGRGRHDQAHGDAVRRRRRSRLRPRIQEKLRGDHRRRLTLLSPMTSIDTRPRRPRRPPRHRPDRPLEDGRRSTGSASMRRLVQIGAVATRRLLPVLVTNPFVRDRDRRKARLGRGLAVAVTDLGVTFVKLGQLIASSPSIAGQTLADAMRGVLDDGPSIPFEQVRAIVEDDLGRPLGVGVLVDRRTARSPLRRSRSCTGRRCSTARDGRGEGAAAGERHDRGHRPEPRAARSCAGWPATVPVGMLPAVPETIEGLAEQLAEELDLRNEARAMQWFDEMIELIGAEGVTVPDTVPEASGPRVLTMALHRRRQDRRPRRARRGRHRRPPSRSRRSSSRGSR